jgi:translocation and assembly module TamB
MRRVLKYFTILAAGFLILCIAVAASVESRFFKHQLRDLVVSLAGNYVHGEISVGRLEGNLFSQLVLSHVLIRSHGDTALFAPKISITFSPRSLLRKQVLLDSIRIDSLYAVARQFPDSSWNLGQLFATGTSATDTSALGWVLRSERTELRGGRLALRPLEASPILPQAIENINARFAWTYADSAKTIHLQEFNLRAREPDLVLRELSFQLAQRRNELLLQDLTIRTAQNRLDGSGALYAKRKIPRDRNRRHNAAVKLSSDPLHFEEFSFAFPFLRLHGNPDFELSTRLRGDSLRFGLAIREQEQRLDLQGYLAHWRQEPQYALAGTINNFDASTWLQNQKWAGIINGNFEVEGRGFSLRALSVRSSAELQDCVLFKRKIQNISWRGDYTDGRLHSTLNVRGDLGEAFIDAALGDSLHAQNFRVRADFKNLHIPPLTVADTLQTVLNLALTAQGRGLHPDTLQARLQLALQPSLLAGVAIDALWGEGEVYSKKIKIDTLNVRSPLGDFHLGGSFDRASSWALRFDGHVLDVTELQRFGLMPADTLAAHGRFAGEIRGFSDSLKATGNFALEHLRYNTIAVDTLTGTIDLQEHGGHWRGRTHVHGENAQTQSLKWHNRFNMRASFADSLAELSLNFAENDSLRGQLKASLVLEDTVTNVSITDFDFRFKSQVWSTTQDTIRLAIGEDSFQIQDLHLVSNEQAIHAQGDWDLKGALNFHCDLAQLDVKSWSELFDLGLPISGRLDAGVRLQGTAQSPLLDGAVAVHAGQIARIPYENLEVKFQYAGERFDWQATFKQNQANQITSTGLLPLNLSFTHQGKRLLPEDSMHIVVHMPSFELSPFKSEFPELHEAAGKLEGDLTIANTPADPHVQGAFRLREGRLEVPRYGIRYSGVQLDLAVDERRIVLNDLQFKRDRGVLSASGFAEYEQKGLQSRITDSQIKVKASNMLLTNHRALEMLIDGNVELSGALRQPRFQGTMKVVRARVDLPTFTEVHDEYEAETQTAQPMLVAALAEQDCTVADLNSKEQQKESSELYQNLRGNLKLEIPRNTWLRSPSLNVEISGELDVVKDGPDFEVFGPIQVLRGTYVLPGISKSFEVENGTLIFQGGADYDPELDLYAKYVFRAADGTKTLRTHITGQSSSPQFTFNLVENNNEEITQTDALAYLIFGRSVKELSQPVADNTNGANNSVAREAVTGMLSDQLSRRLGQELGVDVLQLRGDESFEQVSFLVGKYITNDLFISYQNQLGKQLETNEPVYSTITVEYEVARFLFLQLIKGDTKTTGFDAIIKIEH